MKRARETPSLAEQNAHNITFDVKVTHRFSLQKRRVFIYFEPVIVFVS